MSRQLLISIHAGSGLLGLVVGLAVFPPPEAKGGRKRFLRLAYGGLLVVLTVSLIVLIITDWPDLEIGARLAFTGLAGLAGVMLTRIWLAHRLVGSGKPGWKRSYVGHIYFTYVSLWVGFAIIPALRSTAPGLWIPVVVATVLVTGSALVHRFERRIGLRSSPVGADQVDPVNEGRHQLSEEGQGLFVDEPSSPVEE